MDHIDTQILQQLQQNAKISMKELATTVHLSSPAVIERIRKLEEQGVIDCKSLSSFCNAHPDVLACYRVAGEISYIVKLATYSVETLEQFIDAAMPYGTPSTNIVLSSTEKQVITPFTDNDLE